MGTLINKNISPDEVKFIVGIGNKIMVFRKARGISRAKLSELTGIPYGQLTNIELRKVGYGIGLLGILSDVLEVDAKEFMP